MQVVARRIKTDNEPASTATATSSTIQPLAPCNHWRTLQPPPDARSFAIFNTIVTTSHAMPKQNSMDVAQHPVAGHTDDTVDTRLLKLECDVLDKIRTAQSRSSSGFRYRFWMKNAVPAARCRYGNSPGSGLHYQSINVVQFTVLACYLPLNLLMLLDERGVPDKVQRQIATFSLLKFWHDYHDEIFQASPSLGRSYISGKWLR